jgi:hypothetical protein
LIDFCLYLGLGKTLGMGSMAKVRTILPVAAILQIFLFGLELILESIFFFFATAVDAWQRLESGFGDGVGELFSYVCLLIEAFFE